MRLALGQRHLAVRTHSYHRPSNRAWRMLVAAGLIAAVGYTGYTLLGRVSTSSSGQLGTFVIKDAYSGSPVPGAQVTIVPLACPDGVCRPSETTPEGVVARMFNTDARGEVRARLGNERVAVYATQREYD